MDNQGLSIDQVHRVLENIETLTLALKLQQQCLEQLGQNVMGMLNGNNRKKVDNDE